jgi:hypothetical protein
VALPSGGLPFPHLVFHASPLSILPLSPVPLDEVPLLFPAPGTTGGAHDCGPLPSDHAGTEPLCAMLASYPCGLRLSPNENF